MEKGGEQSAKKQTLELVVANGPAPVKREMVVREGGETVPAEQGPTMEISLNRWTSPCSTAPSASAPSSHLSSRFDYIPSIDSSVRSIQLIKGGAGF